MTYKGIEVPGVFWGMEMFCILIIVEATQILCVKIHRIVQISLYDNLKSKILKSQLTIQTKNSNVLLGS